MLPPYTCPICGKKDVPAYVAQGHLNECKRKQALKVKQEKRAQEEEISRQASTFETQFVTWLRTPHGRFELFWAETRREPTS